MRIFYFLLEDIKNQRELREVEFLSGFGRVVVLSHDRPESLPAGARWFRVRRPPAWFVSFLTLWRKASLACGKAVPSRYNLEFPARNVYIRNRFLKGLVDFAWTAKLRSGLNRVAPRYDKIFFLPMRLALAIGGPKLRRRRPGQSFALIDAILVRNLPFWPVALAMRARGSSLVGVVKSWDNPFYSQLLNDADGFITWADAMTRDVRGLHAVDGVPFVSWGASPFRPFVEHVDGLEPAIADRPAGKPLTIGYAAAYHDTVMSVEEVSLVVDIADALKSRLPEARLLFRPYPVNYEGIYDRLKACDNVEIVEIAGPSADRFGDGRERIFFGSPEEKVDYLDRCDLFVSMATSFTIEAAIRRRPIVHFWLPPEARAKPHERKVFDCIDTNDHLELYYTRLLPTCRSVPELIEAFAAAGGGALPDPKAGEILADELGARMADLKAPQRFEAFLREWA